MSLLLRALRQAEEQKKLQQSAEDAAGPEHPLPELQLDDPSEGSLTPSLSQADMPQVVEQADDDTGLSLQVDESALLTGDSETGQSENGPLPVLPGLLAASEMASAPPSLPVTEPAAIAAPAAQPAPETRGAEARMPVSAEGVGRRVIWLMIAGGTAVLIAALWVFWQWYRLQPSATLPQATAMRASAAVTSEKHEQGVTSQIHAAALAPSPLMEPVVDASSRSAVIVTAIPLSASSPAHADAKGPAVAAPLPRFERQPPANPEINAWLQQGWQHYQQGELEQSLQAYRTVLRGDSGNRDALLGVAAIAVQQGRPDAAQAVYQRLLQLYPRDADAQAGLLALQSFDEVDASRLHQQDHPANTLLLAQHYVRQQRWAEAQELYFQAWERDSDNPDLAFNLAVCLDQLGQARLAGEYYGKAIQLAGRQPYRFNLDAVMRRLQQLAGDAP
ncbi:tetratricopeptide repeat protein [Chitinilyticum piscinae]|uniref:Tetratricopeptide repeat protein n=1 Tax=Chitinilyticum piscinae TaxID=2866724 RepID=A0A8J7FKI4_9NEIS|nr:tetratricopeptide repeat protein [Chitinilyticum piscinae]MBE9607756.1 tetratricopeptide repeat protein [Chitinilyticum piscinae]